MRIAQPEPYGPVPDPELLGDLSKASSPGPQPMHFFMINNPAGTTKLLPSSPRVPNPGADPLADEVTLKLGDSGNDCEQRLPQRAGRVNVLLIRDELNTEGAKFLECQQQMFGRPGETVKAPDHDGIELPLASIGHQVV